MAHIQSLCQDLVGLDLNTDCESWAGIAWDWLVLPAASAWQCAQAHEHVHSNVHVLAAAMALTLTAQ